MSCALLSHLDNCGLCNWLGTGRAQLWDVPGKTRTFSFKTFRSRAEPLLIATLDESGKGVLTLTDNTPLDSLRLWMFLEYTWTSPCNRIPYIVYPNVSSKAISFSVCLIFWICSGHPPSNIQILNDDTGLCCPLQLERIPGSSNLLYKMIGYLWLCLWVRAKGQMLASVEALRQQSLLLWDCVMCCDLCWYKT